MPGTAPFDAEAIDAAFEQAVREAIQHHFRNGQPITYGDPEYGHAPVREYPDGRRYLLNHEGEQIREIEPVHRQ